MWNLLQPTNDLRSQFTVNRPWYSLWIDYLSRSFPTAMLPLQAVTDKKKDLTIHDLECNEGNSTSPSNSPSITSNFWRVSNIHPIWRSTDVNADETTDLGNNIHNIGELEAQTPVTRATNVEDSPSKTIGSNSAKIKSSTPEALILLPHPLLRHFQHEHEGEIFVQDTISSKKTTTMKDIFASDSTPVKIDYSTQSFEAAQPQLQQKYHDYPEFEVISSQSSKRGPTAAVSAVSTAVMKTVSSASITLNGMIKRTKSGPGKIPYPTNAVRRNLGNLYNRNIHSTDTKISEETDNSNSENIVPVNAAPSTCVPPASSHTSVKDIISKLPKSQEQPRAQSQSKLNGLSVLNSDSLIIIGSRPSSNRPASHSQSRSNSPGGINVPRSNSSTLWSRGDISKFKNVDVRVGKQESQLPSNSALSTAPGDQNMIQCNHLFFACSLEKRPGAFIVVPFDSAVKGNSCNKYTSNVVEGHRAAVIDFDFSPFDHQLLASCSDDATVKLWRVPEITTDNHHKPSYNLINTAETTLKGHERKVYCAKFHPSVRSLLCSVSADGTSRLWNVETGTTMSCTGNHLYDTSYHDLVWGAAGSSYRVSSKDQRLHFIDARTSAVAAVVNKAHEGGRSIKLVSLWDDADRLLSVGCGKASMRQVKIWDPRHMQSEVFKLDLDTAPGVVMPFFDRCTGLLYLSGKGETSIRYYEVSAAADIQLLGDFKSSVPVKGMAMAPKRALDVMSCEIGRFIKFVDTYIESQTIFVPRKATSFQDDLYPEIYSDIPPHTTSDWLEGSNAMPSTISMKPAYIEKMYSNKNRGLISLSRERSLSFNFNRIKSTSEDTRLSLSPLSEYQYTPITEEMQVAELESQIRKAKLRIFMLEKAVRKAGLDPGSSI